MAKEVVLVMDMFGDHKNYKHERNDIKDHVLIQVQEQYIIAHQEMNINQVHRKMIMMNLRQTMNLRSE